MKGAGPILRLEFRRNINKFSIGILIIIILTSAVIHQLGGIGKYKSTIASQSGFIELEQQRISSYHNYYLLSLMGFKMLSAPCPIISIFHNTSAFSDLEATIDGAVRFHLSKPQMGGEIFEKPTGGVLDLSWYLLIIGGLFVFSWSFHAFSDSEYIRLLLNFSDTKALYAGIIGARLLLTTLFLAIIFIVLWVQFLLNGIVLTTGEISSVLIFFLVAEIAMVFLLLTGSIIGTVRNRLKGGAIAVLFWLILFLIWPEILNSIFSESAARNMKSAYDNEARKMEISLAFESSFIKNLKKYKTAPERLEAIRDMFAHYWDNEYKRIEKLDLGMIGEKEDFVRRFHLWSILSPVTFYKSVNNELSGYGFNSYLKFNKAIQVKQKEFKKFHIKKRFYETNPKVEPFLKGDDYIFQTASSLPGYFGVGLIWNVFLIFTAFVFSYSRFKRVIFTQVKRRGAFEKLELEYASGQHVAYRVDDRGFAHLLFGIFMGKTGNFRGRISIDGESIVSGEKQDFIYLPNPAEIPGEIKTGTFLNTISTLLNLRQDELEELRKEFDNILNKRWGELQPVERVGLLLKLATFKNPKIYLFNDFFLGVSYKVLEEIVEGYKSKDILTLELLSMNAPRHAKLDYFYIVTLVHSEYEFDIVEKRKS